MFTYFILHITLHDLHLHIQNYTLTLMWCLCQKSHTCTTLFKYSPNKRNYCWTKNLTLKNKNLIGKVVIDLDFAKPTKSRLLNHEWGPNYLTISSKSYVHFDKKLLKMGSIEHHLLTFVIFQNMPIHVCISTIHWVLGLESLMCVCKLHRGAYKWV
jgi:hypothetical protein